MKDRFFHRGAAMEGYTMTTDVWQQILDNLNMILPQLIAFLSAFARQFLAAFFL